MNKCWSFWTDRTQTLNEQHTKTRWGTKLLMASLTPPCTHTHTCTHKHSWCSKTHSDLWDADKAVSLPSLPKCQHLLFSFSSSESRAGRPVALCLCPVAKHTHTLTHTKPLSHWYEELKLSQVCLYLENFPWQVKFPIQYLKLNILPNGKVRERGSGIQIEIL